MPSSENTGYLVQLKSPEGENVYPIISAEMIKDKNGETYNLSELKEAVPSGIIVMWSGASDAIPSGWYLCDGQNGTPDLRNRFIVGAGSSYEVGNTGGSDSVTLTTEQMPSHSHGNTFKIDLSNLKCASAGKHTHTVRTASGWENASRDSGVSVPDSTTTATTSESGAHTHSITGSGSLSGSISNTGGGQSHENRPPYYALCFIMKA